MELLLNKYKIHFMAIAAFAFLVGMFLSSVLSLSHYFLGIILFAVVTLIMIDKPKFIILSQIVVNALIKGVISYAGGLSFLNYFSDYLTILLLFNILVVFKYRITDLKIIRIPLLSVLALFILNVLSTVYNDVGIITFIWGLRVNFRFIIFFVGCIFFINEKVVSQIERAIIAVFTLQVPVCTFQFLSGVHQDNIGGTFGGWSEGGTLTLSIFIGIAFMISFRRYIEDKSSLFLLILNLGLGLYVSAISEGKAAIVFLLIIMMCGFIFKKLSASDIGLGILLLIGIYMFFIILSALYPNFSDFNNINVISKYMSQGSYGSSGINRLNGIGIINPLLDFIQKCIGVGIGNAAPSQFTLLKGAYYTKYGCLNYYNFTYAYSFFETGYLGLVLYSLFFITTALSCWKNSDIKYRVYEFIGFTAAIISLSSMVYNNAIKMETIGYMLYGLMAFPFALAINKHHPTIKTVENKGGD